MRRFVACALGLVVLLGTAGPAYAGAAPKEVEPSELAEPDVEIFMKVNATDGQINAVREVVESSAAIERFAFLDKDDAFAEFTQIFSKQPELIVNITPDQLPTSFVIDLASDARVRQIRGALNALSGIDEVQE